MTWKVMVTYRPEDDERVVIQEGLTGIARINYLKETDENDRPRMLKETDVVLSKSFSSEEINRQLLLELSKATLIQLIYAGADNVPFNRVPENITVASNAGAFAEPLAEHVLAMALTLAKSLVPNHRRLEKGDFDDIGLNTYLKGRVCGIVGLGGNGIAVAKLMRAIGMKIHAVDVCPGPGIEVDFFGSPRENLPEMLSASDVLVLTVPLTKETRGMIDRKALQTMKKGAILINVARGRVVDQEALYKHLSENPKFRAGIDTWWEEPGTHGAFRLEYPFFELPNIIGSPHNADMVPGMMPEATRLAVENIKNHLRGEKIRGILNRQDYSDGVI
jgi:phosphoglycerate dehydrogenase-like enzyme